MSTSEEGGGLGRADGSRAGLTFSRVDPEAPRSTLP
jgi:hypothetical protein